MPDNEENVIIEPIKFPEPEFEYVRDNGDNYTFKYKDQDDEWNVGKDAEGNVDYHRIMDWLDKPGNTPTLPEAPTVDLVAYAANKRWEKETGGMDFSGTRIATDDRAKIMISGARQAADQDANFTTPWVASDGSTVVMDAPTIIAMSNAMLQHVNDVFGLFSEVAAQIASEDITTTEQIDAIFEVD